jgi:hypothetical protein
MNYSSAVDSGWMASSATAPAERMFALDRQYRGSIREAAVKGPRPGNMVQLGAGRNHSLLQAPVGCCRPLGARRAGCGQRDPRSLEREASADLSLGFTGRCTQWIFPTYCCRRLRKRTQRTRFQAGRIQDRVLAKPEAPATVSVAPSTRSDRQTDRRAPSARSLGRQSTPARARGMRRRNRSR